jgi:hypothetical protein
VRGRGGTAAAPLLLRAAFVVVIAALAWPLLGAPDAAATVRSRRGADVRGLREAPRAALAPSLSSADERQRPVDRAKWSKAFAVVRDVVTAASALVAAATGSVGVRRAGIRPRLGASSRGPPLPLPA